MRATLATINGKVIIQIKSGCRKHNKFNSGGNGGIEKGNDKQVWKEKKERRWHRMQKLQTATYAVCQWKMRFHMVQVLLLQTAM